MSSGSIAYAAQFNKPVYVPSTGLLSKLVKKYKIGKVVDDFSDVSFLNDKIDINSNYCIDHTVEKFYKQLLNIKQMMNLVSKLQQYIGDYGIKEGKGAFLRFLNSLQSPSLDIITKSIGKEGLMLLTQIKRMS